MDVDGVLDDVQVASSFSMLRRLTGTSTCSLAEVGVERGPRDERFARCTERHDVPEGDA